MKIVLVVLNILLAGLVLWSGVNFFKDLTQGSKKTAFTVKKRDPHAVSTAVEAVPAREAAVKTASGEEQVKEIVEQDIFNQDRCPNAGVWGGGNARLEMTLVGTFTIGNTKGAVILQKAQNRPAFMPFGGMMGGPGGMMGQRRQGIGPGGMGVPGGGQGRFGGGGGGGQGRFGGGDGGGDGRRQIGGMRSMSMNRNAQGIVQPGQQNNNNTNVTYKQYVRVGETLANGYKLTEVDRNRVILTRGSDRLELELSDASKNAAKSNQKRNNNNRQPNQNQVMQQLLQGMQNMQRAQMMQGFQMMRMSQQNIQNMQNQQNNGRNGTAPRRR
ncbi:MAG: hypothetical protein IJS14_13565 [Lentisphaeria bacterium]|nr:hypothetical protein [Lentisphaeria bacterium]